MGNDISQDHCILPLLQTRALNSMDLVITSANYFFYFPIAEWGKWLNTIALIS